MGRPTVSDLVYVFGPDLDGRRIEEVADPSRLAGEAAERMTDRVVDEVVERSGFAQPEAEPPLPDAGLQAEPEAEPETHDTRPAPRSEEHTSELQSQMRTSYAVFCLKKKTDKQ